MNDKLTDRTALPDNQISSDLLLHVVDPADTSQNPAGSSFFATRSQLHKAIPITKAALLTLYNAGTMKNTLYKITDRADDGIFILANSNALSLESIGVFLNPDFQAAGGYVGVAGFAGQLGRWNAGLTPVINNVVIWNGIHYVNQTGAVGTEPDGDGVNWIALVKNVVNGYIKVFDFIGYDLVNDLITFRKDRLNNYVEKHIDTFQWGNNTTKNNKVNNGASLNCLNATQVIANNIFTDFSTTDLNALAYPFFDNLIKDDHTVNATDKTNFNGSIVQNAFCATKLVQLFAITGDGTTQVIMKINGTNEIIVPAGSIWRIVGDGVLLGADGSQGYFKFEANLQNQPGGTNIYLNHVKVKTKGGGTVIVGTASAANSDTFSGSNSTGEQIVIADTWPDGSANCTSDIGFGLTTAQVSIERSTNKIRIKVRGIPDVVILWNAYATIHQTVNF